MRAWHFRDASVWATETQWRHLERRGTTRGARPKRRPSWAGSGQLREWRVVGRRRRTRPVTAPASSRKQTLPASGPAAGSPSPLRASTPTRSSRCAWHAARRPLQRRWPSSGASTQARSPARPGCSSSPRMGRLRLQQGWATSIAPWAEGLRAPRLRAFGAPGALHLRSRVAPTA